MFLVTCCSLLVARYSLLVTKSLHDLIERGFATINHPIASLKAGQGIHYQTSPPLMGGDKGEGELRFFPPLKGHVSVIFVMPDLIQHPVNSTCYGDGDRAKDLSLSGTACCTQRAYAKRELFPFSAPLSRKGKNLSLCDLCASSPAL